ncbi:hypothetical protein MMC11_005141 [Xylographa trunciseda]|nr:hypothetical protein [Xylographa trunciseda]
MTDSTPKSYHTDPTLWLYTSLTAGSSHIITATSRLETILKANKVPFNALDVATDEKARMLWGRRAGKRKLPGLVRMGMVVGASFRHQATLTLGIKGADCVRVQDLEEVEEWNEYGEIKQNLIFSDALPAASTPTPSTTNTPSKPPPPPVAASSSSKPPTASSAPLATSAPAATSAETPLTTAMRQASLEAAAKAKQSKTQSLAARKAMSEAQPSASLSAASGSNADMPSKLDNSAPGGALPPTGTSEAEEAVEATAKSEGVTFKGADKLEDESGLGKTPEQTMMHRGSNVSMASPEEIKAVEESSRIAEAPEEDGVAEEDTGKEVVAGPEAVKTEDATAATDKAEELPGTKTQEQDAGQGEKVGESVAD